MTLPSVKLRGIAGVLREAHLLTEVRGPEDVAVSGTSQDSRTTRPGDLFVAWVGTARDAHEFVAAAAEAGAAAAVVERPIAGVDLPQLVVSDGRTAAAIVAQIVAGSPANALELVAVTGTNGKTTTASLARHLLSRRTPTASLGTLGVIDPDGSVRPDTVGLTTPGPVEFAEWLRELRDTGACALVLEASSHALDQRRLDGVRFAVAAFTNLSRDHLDYHPDMESYRAAKLRLLDLLEEDGSVVVNASDPAWSEMDLPGRTLRFAVVGRESDVEAEVHLIAHSLVAEAAGTTFQMVLRSEGGSRARMVKLPLVGAFNVENALAATGIALAMGVELDDVVAGLESAPSIPGRLEVVVAGPVTVLIDFAHTPDALERVLATLRPLARSRLIVLFGAGGDRDRAKRGPMAGAVARWADLVVLTSDNPRTEDPERILDDLEAGLGQVVRHREADRRTAIHWAITEADRGDLVLLAGKGHERYQVIGSEKRPFDEAEIARRAWAGRGAA